MAAAAAAATAASIACSIVVGLNLGPLQTREAVGRPQPGDDVSNTVYLALLASNALWTALGIAGLSTGIAAAAKDRGRGEGIAAILVSAAAPVLSFVI